MPGVLEHAGPKSPELADLLAHPDLRALNEQFGHQTDEHPDLHGLPRLDTMPLAEQARAEYQRRLGSVALGETIRTSPEKRNAEEVSLAESCRQAKAGDPAARARVRPNVAFVASEAFYKARHISTAESELDQDQDLSQLGVKHWEVHENSLRFCDWPEAMRQEIQVEALNTFIIQEAARQGLLKNNVISVPSMVISRLSPEQQKNVKFFVETMTVAWQFTTEIDGKIVTQTAFLAGVAERGAQRHDIEAFRRLYAKLGDKNAALMTDQEFRATPRLIRKGETAASTSEDPHRELSAIVERYIELLDDETAGIVDHPVFFGQKGPKGDYAAVVPQSRKHEAGLADLIDQMTDELIQKSDAFNHPMDAVDELYDLMKIYGPERAAKDKTKNPDAFGVEAGNYIREYQRYEAMGLHEKALRSLRNAQRTAIVTICPSGKKNSDEAEKAGKQKKNDNDFSEDNLGQEAEAGGICLVKTDRCFCCKYDEDFSLLDSPREVDAFIDEKETIHCLRPHCKAWMTKDGKDNFPGYIALIAEAFHPEKQN